jgi:ATP-binding cassette subfamily C exporter for protease/lipase
MIRPIQSLWTQLGVSKGLFNAFGLVLLFSLFVNLLILTSPIYMMQVYDRVLVSSRVETLLFLSAMALVALAVLGMLDGVRGFLLTRVGRYLDLTLRDPVLIHAIAQSRSGGAVQRRLVDDLGVMRNYLGSTAVLPFLDAPWVPFFLIIIALMHPWLGVLAVVSAVLLFGLALANDYMARKALRLANGRQAAATEFSGAAIQNAEVIHAMGMQKAISERYSKHVGEMGEASQKAADVGAAITAASKALRMAVQSAVLGLGAYLVIKAELSPGGMIASSIVLGRALAPIEQTIGSWKQSVLALDAYNNVRKFLSETPTEDERIAAPNLQGRLSVEAVSYQMPGQERATLSRVSFRLDPGTALALVGPSASGKSTLCRLLVGAIAPSAGAVRIDGAAVIGLRPEDVAATVGYLPQNVELFGGTVKDNIARLGQVDDAAVVAAARAAGCHEMILRLEDGYETELGPRGMFLSGGQRQRIGLARALYGNPRLLVLDEPNSNLDQEGEIALVEAIANAKADGASVVVVSHRATLLRPIDKLGVLRDGILEKFGDRDDVLREMAPQPPVQKPTLVPTVDGVQASGGKAS